MSIISLFRKYQRTTQSFYFKLSACHIQCRHMWPTIREWSLSICHLLTCSAPLGPVCGNTLTGGTGSTRFKISSLCKSFKLKKPRLRFFTPLHQLKCSSHPSLLFWGEKCNYFHFLFVSPNVAQAKRINCH